jgi:hypothetical protein
MRYIKTSWLKEGEFHPIATYVEIDHKRWETRKVDYLLGGKIAFADESREVGTWLTPEKFPTIAEYKGNSEVVVTSISSEEFEKAWQHALASNEAS